MEKNEINMSEICHLKSNYGKIMNIPIQICPTCKQKFIPSPGAMKRCLICKYNKYGKNK